MIGYTDLLPFETRHIKGGTRLVFLAGLEVGYGLCLLVLQAIIFLFLGKREALTLF
jgi:hypothetical protein